MSVPELVIRTAKRHVQNYIHEWQDLIAGDVQSDNVRDCEAFLDVAIEAFKWLMRATRDVHSAAIHAADSAADAALSAEETSLRDCCIAWLKPCDFAQAWAEKQQLLGNSIEQLAEFRNCCETMRRTVAEDAKMSKLSARVPGHDALADIAIDPPPQWIEEPSWTTGVAGG